MQEHFGPPTEPADPEARLWRAIAAIDAANAEDPHHLTIDRVDQPKELAHAELMTQWVRTLDPDADDAQLVAARAHHLRRWEIARSIYPDGRPGYLRWRSASRRRHAEQVSSMLADVGYDEDFIERVQRIIRKEGLASDPAVQTHEDALCLVFLHTQLDELAAKLGDEHTVEVLRKSVAKMSAAGVAAAGQLELTDRGRGLLERALVSE